MACRYRSTLNIVELDRHLTSFAVLTMKRTPRPSAYVGAPLDDGGHRARELGRQCRGHRTLTQAK